MHAGTLTPSPKAMYAGNLSNRRADISNIPNANKKNNQSSDERALVAMLLNGVGTKITH